MSWEVVTDHKCLLGESPVWDEKNNRILWVDILKGEIHWYYPEQNKHQLFKTGQMTGAIARRSSGGIVAAQEHGFYEIYLQIKTSTPIFDPERHLPQNRFNDGKCDPAGRFWAGTMSKRGAAKAGKLYALEKDHTVSVKIEGVGCSNGLAWSPDGTLFYFIDTLTQNVVAYDYEISTGSISNKRIIIEVPKKLGLPDGMTIDDEGMLWIALWNGWKVCRYNPFTGKLLREISLPAAQITSCTFGGSDMSDLYVTSACVGLTDSQLQKQPYAGCTFIIKNIGYSGLPALTFQG